MRKPRQKSKNAVYHVIARTDHGDFILNSKEMKYLFIKILKRAKKKFDFNLRNFIIMSNHVHLMLQPLNSTDLSKLMQWILSVFAMSYNKINKMKGHVWYDRFKSKIIESISQYLRTFIYINENPVKAGILKSAEDYQFGGMRYIMQNNSKFVAPPDPLLCELLKGLGYSSFNYYKKAKIGQESNSPKEEECNSLHQSNSQ